MTRSGASNPHILPIIIPPISTVEYNRTPLIGIHALNTGGDNFAKEFYDSLVRAGVIERNDISDTLLSNFNVKIKAEMSILRRDSNGFYVARLVDQNTRKTQQTLPTNQSKVDQLLFGRRNNALIHNEALWRLNGLLDIETDKSIAEHWIAVRVIDLYSKKLQFEIDQLLEQQGNQKLYSIKNFYELP